MTFQHQSREFNSPAFFYCLSDPRAPYPHPQRKQGNIPEVPPPGRSIELSIVALVRLWLQREETRGAGLSEGGRGTQVVVVVVRREEEQVRNGGRGGKGAFRGG